MLSGKTPNELLEMANNMATERGMSLADVAGEFGIRL